MAAVEAPVPTAPVQVAPVAAAPAQPGTTLTQLICFVALCLYILSAPLNDYATKLIGHPAYLNRVAEVLLPVAWFLSGTFLRALQHRIGLYWLGFGGWLLLASPTSVWRGGTFTLLINYFPRSYLILFYIAACAVSVVLCRRLMYVSVVISFLTALECYFFGSTAGGRFRVPDTIFAANANDLGLQLLVGIASLSFAFFTGSKLLKALAVVGMQVSVVYLLRTGSRGDLVAFIAMAAAAVLCSRHRVLLAAAAAAVFFLGLLFVSAASRERLAFIPIDINSAEAHNETEESALYSQAQRQYLLRKSIEFSFTHPLFGVGPGQFMVAEYGEKEKAGKPGTWRGTHNTYTEVSSEAGIPAFVFYIAATIVGLRANYRRYKSARAMGLKEISGLSFTLFLALLAWTVGTFFASNTYTGMLPTILGMTIAVELASKPAMA